MKFRIAIVVAAASGLVLSSAAAAHVTLNPGEWEAGGFARFDVRVPNERPNASTTRLTMQFPENVLEASFEDVPGWKRSVEMVPLDEPIEQEGEEPITERIGTVTWSGGEVEPGEFVEFGISFQVPEDAAETELLFPALQTYSDGEVVRWIADDPEAESPAPRIAVLAAAEEQPAGTEAEPSAGGGGAAAQGGGSSDDDSTATLALVFGVAGLAAGLVSLAVAFLRPRGVARTR